MGMIQDIDGETPRVRIPAPRPRHLMESKSRFEGITVGFGAFLLLFQATGPGVAISILGLGVFVLAAARAAARQTVRAHGMTYFEMVMAAIVTASGLAFYYIGIVTSAQFTVLFAITALSVSFIARGYSPAGLFKWAAISHLVMIVAVAAVNLPEMMAGLDAGASNRWALRFKPFGLHPNLTGFIFSGAVIFLLYGALTSTRWLRWLFLGGAILSMAAVLAASARGGLVALTLSSLLMAGFYWRRVFAPRPRLTILGIALLLIVLALTWTQVLDYLVTILELNSSRRGLASGGTGRVERWLTSLDIIEAGRLRLFIGMGLRTIGQETFGFNSTENSYLNIAIESGLFVLVATLVLFFGAAFRLFQRSRMDPDPVWVFMTWLLLYVCIQSMFNRYLLGIGNSLSFYVLLTTAIAWLPLPGKARVRKTKHLMPWEVRQQFQASRT